MAGGNGDDGAPSGNRSGTPAASFPLAVEPAATMETTTQNTIRVDLDEDVAFEDEPLSPAPRVVTRPRTRRRGSQALLPERLGEYFLVERIGSGGMGDVFKAVRAEEDAHEGPRQFFAVKRIRAEFGSHGDQVKRLMDEARITALLKHPNIVRVYDLQQVERSYFIVMEYLDGADLASVLRALKRTKMSLRAAPVAEIGAQVARGLHYAHTFADANGHPCQIVHRDISPSNLMLLREGGVKIVDFGVAKASEMLRTTETMPGTVRGKPAYFSPEQARGEALDGRSDIFSLGVTLWELLTGRRLFSAPNSIDRLKAVLGSPVEPPSVHRPGIPAAVDRIVLRALHKERSRRYQTALELAEDLESFLRASSVRRDALPYVLRTLFRAARTGLVPVSSDTLSTPVTKSLSDPAGGPALKRAPALDHEVSEPAPDSSDRTVGLGPVTPRPAKPLSEVTPLNRAVSGLLSLRERAVPHSLASAPDRNERALGSVMVSPSARPFLRALTPLPALPQGAPKPARAQGRGSTGPLPYVVNPPPILLPPPPPPLPTTPLPIEIEDVADFATPMLRSRPLPLVTIPEPQVPAPRAMASRPARRAPVLRWLAALVGLGLGVGGARFVEQATTSPVAQVSTPPEVVKVHLEVRSEPDGAIVSSSAGVLGTTPLVLVRAQGQASERFQFQKEGYETTTLDVSSEKDTVVQVSLRPLPPPAPPAASAEASDVVPPAPPVEAEPRALVPSPEVEAARPRAPTSLRAAPSRPAPPRTASPGRATPSRTAHAASNAHGGTSHGHAKASAPSRSRR